MNILLELEEAARATLLARAAPLSLPVGARLFRPGDLCAGFPILLTGSVRVTRLSRAGREMLLYRVGPGETCIMTAACLLSAEPYAVSGVAEAATTALFLPPPAFEALLAASAGFRHLVFRGYAARLAGLMQRIEALSEPIETRLATHLLGQARNGEVRATHQALALEIGSSREVVSRALARMAKSGLLSHARGVVRVLAQERLAAMAG